MPLSILAFAVPVVAISRRRRRTQQIGAIYARYSTRFQDSVKDQIRECRVWAEQNGLEIRDDLIFIDRGRSGSIRRRPGRLALQQAIEADRFDVLVVFATSRLERNDYRIKQFVQEEIIERSKRAVFIMSNIDTDDSSWDVNLSFRGIIDSQYSKMNSEHIRAGQAGLFLKGLVHGTITFGYRGIEVADTKTRAGRPGRKYVIDPDTATWIKRIFAWFVQDRLSMSAIIKRLNAQQAPLPPKCASGRWTRMAVRILLHNERYRGCWSYGKKQSVLLNRKDYVRQVLRDQPLQQMQIDDLRIIDDETWFTAQKLMTNNPHIAGRKSIDGDRKKRPKLLNGILKCGYHKRNLITGGGQGHMAICPVCKECGDTGLYTMLERGLALEMVCGKIAELLQANRERLIETIIASCQQAVEAQQRPDPAEAGQLRTRHDKLSKQIGYILDMPVETDEDRRENHAKVAELRGQRADIDVELARFDAAAKKPITVPTAQEIRALFDNAAQVLTDAVGGDDEATARARQVIETVTGEEIMVYQAGLRKRARGWLKGVFKVHILRFVADRYGVRTTANDGTDVEIEFRRLPIYEKIADDVKVLWDAGLKYREIAKKIGWNRNLVAKAIAFWHKSRNLSAPDGRNCVSRLKRQPHLAERIADEVMELVKDDIPIREIAERLGTSRNRITEAIKIWHNRCGLPVPDGRALRKLRNQRKRSV